jgi:plasmid stabilization system protein ParE
MRLVLRPGAKADLREAFLWYEERQPGLGGSLLESVEAVFSLLREHPLLYPRVDPAVRRAGTDRFPFGVFYRVDGETIRVIAVLHNARNPARWKGRT